MQTQDSLTVSRRPLDIDDYIDILRRHKGWIAAPLFAGVVISVVVAYLIPDTYVSAATIKVVPQQVPESLIQSNVNQLMSDRITSIASQVESRTVLGAIITTNNLYPRERDRMPLADVIEKMRRSIIIGPVASVNAGGQNTRVPAFQIAFSYTDRNKAQKVVQELATKFIDQNLREQNSTSIGTTTLLHDEWENAKRELEQAESKLADFRARNRGRLPDEMQSNLQQLNGLQVRMANVNASLSRISQEKLVMETQLRIYKDQMAAIDQQAANQPGVSLAHSDAYNEAEREVKFWENQLSALRQHYKDSYPDVRRAKNLLEAAKKKLDAALKSEGDGQKDDETAKQPRLAPTVARERAELEAAYRRLQSQIEAKDLEAEENRKELERVKEAINAYEMRLQGTPFSDKEYSELIRDRDLARAKFMDLDAKWSRSQLAQEMVNRSQGERLEILDQASLPSEPSAPKRPMIVGMGAAIGLLLGIVFAGAREMKDTSLKNLKDVRAYTQLPILGSVPLLENDYIVKRRRRMAWLAWSVACLAGIAIMSGSIIYYYMKTA